MSVFSSRRSFLANAGGAWVSAAMGCLGGASSALAQGAASRESSKPPYAARIDQVDPELVRQFASGLEGRAIKPGDGTYDAVRQVWNAAYDKRPGLIVVCSNASDAARTVEFAHRHDLLLAVRSGGHSVAGKSTCDGGIVVDLSGLKGVKIDSAKRIARVGSGLTLAEFDGATAAEGLATTSGTEPSTGIAGLTLGGGLGWLMGKYGFACDNVRSVDIVLADGKAVTASSTKNPDLYWAVRGAGANFGVVTALEYDLHPVASIYGGVLKFPHESLRDVMKHYREFVHTIPDEVGISLGVIPSASGKPLASMAVSYCGDPAEGEKVLRQLRSFRPILSDDVKVMPYLAFQKRGGLPPKLRFHAYVRSSFLSELSDDAIEVIATNAATAPPFSGSFVIECVHGKAARMPLTAAAFPHRFFGHNFSVHADWIEPAEEDSAKKWGTTFWAAMQPHVRAAVYSNYLAEEGQSRVMAGYGANYQRLAVLKRKYDPSNFFHMNQNVLPAV
ncbi:MAG: FAD-binding oxidoreductase [Polyangiaceae bacterium]